MTSGGQDNSAHSAQREKPGKGRKKGGNDDDAPQKDEYQLEIESELRALEKYRPRALEILEQGDPLSFLLDTFNKIHVGDRDAAEVQFIAFGCQASCNSHGIQANWTGPSGKGKSAGAEACYHLLPKMYILKGSVSAKSLFYHKDLPDGACIFLDDLKVEEGSDLEATIKRSTSAFQEGAYHETLDGNRQLLRMRLPKRLCWTLTYVDVIESGDQFLNRMFVIKTDSSREADEQVCRHILLRAERGESAFPVIEEVTISKAMMLDIKNKPPYRVVIPNLSERVSFTDRRNRRNPDLFVDLVIGLACLRHRQRKREHISEGEWTLYASMEDIREAARIFNAQGDYLGSRLDDAERAAALFIFEAGEAGLSIKALAEKLRAKYPEDGWNEKRARRLLLGRQEKNGGMGGLAGRLPGLYAEDVAHCNEYGCIVGKPVKHFKFPPDVSKLDFFGLQVMVKEPMDASISDDTVSRNSPKSPVFPIVSGERQNESCNHIISTRTPNSLKNESEEWARAESRDLPVAAKSGELGDFGEIAGENRATDRENCLSLQREYAGESGGEMSDFQGPSQVPLDKPEARLEANVKRLEDLKQESIRRKREAKRMNEATSYHDASLPGNEGNTSEGSENHNPGEGNRAKDENECSNSSENLDNDAILSRCYKELSKRNPEITSFKLADLARAIGCPIPIDKCKAWLMNRASSERNRQRDCGSCSVAIKGDRSAIKCNPCCYLGDNDSGDVAA